LFFRKFYDLNFHQNFTGSANNQESVIRTDNVVIAKRAKAKTSVAIYHGIDGKPLGGDVVSNLTQFQVNVSSVLVPIECSLWGSFLCSLIMFFI
jgi:hypothetical protein